MDSDDLIQEVYLKLFAARRARYLPRSPAKLVAYLRQTVFHLAADFNRRHLETAKRGITHEQHISTLQYGWDAGLTYRHRRH